MFNDTPEGTTHSYNDGCGIKEHNETLREKWEVYALSTIADHDELNTNDVFKWFLAQFDAMLAEDIGALSSKRMEVPDNSLAQYANREAMGFNAGLNRAIDILEARRLSLKK